MDLIGKIADLLEEKYATDPLFADCFTIDIILKPGNQLNVFIDADSPFSFDRCQKMSRYLEYHLDTNKWLSDKYVLEVSSPGVERPLKFIRQYIKNIGRILEITLKDNNQKVGKLVAADEEQAVIEYEVKEKAGRKMVASLVRLGIPYEQIEKAIVRVVF